MLKKSILLVTHVKFWLENRGDLARITSLYRFLKTRGFLVSVCFVGQLAERDQSIIRSKYQNLEIFSLKKSCPTKKGYQKRVKSIQKMMTRKILQYYKPNWLLSYTEPKLQDFRSEEYVELFKQICRDVQPDYIFVESIRLAYLIKDARSILPKHTITIIDNMDVMHQRCRIFHEFGEKHWVNITEQEEAQTLSLFDVVIAIQNKDGAMFKKMLPGKQVITVYHATEIISHPINLEFPVRLAYIGTKSTHNRHAIESFLKTTWPMIHARFNDQVVLNIIGSVCHTINTSSLPDGANLLGFVENLETVYRDTDIVINPAYFGGGLKIKNVEALCNGKALVTTTVGSEGLEHGIDEAFIVCDTPDDAIKTLTLLIGNPSLRQALSINALAFARKNFSQEAAYKELSQLLNGGMPENNQRGENHHVTPTGMIPG